ncbi:MAG: C69 family dipeptidase [Candidatus Eiseniibacteriota bacterium]|nr:MAG: C69 family dipeptidase [Candidatus Eisenbacteria bacterium]
MKRLLLAEWMCLFVFLLPWGAQAAACTNLLVTRGASVDGSVMITYTCDGEFHPILRRAPAAAYEPGDSLEVKDWSGKLLGKVKQVEHTYSHVGLINEHQLAISETTFGGREELRNPDGLLHYWTMMQLALERAKTAREAVRVMTDLVEEYGYRSTGESFSIADTREAWILEMIGPGPGGRGAIWVAVRVPDGYISSHANKARVGQFPMNDPENCVYSENVVSFAVEKGYYDPKSGEPFRFCEAYCPATPKNQRYAEARVWSIFHRAAPSLKLSADYHRAVPGAQPYPLWVKPDKKLSLADVFSLMRDHYEGTDYDMTKGVDAGPYGTPNRWRPMHWMVDSVEYAWERPISTQQTGFSFVSQSRSWLPDPVGGVLWYGVDDTYTTCYFPLYCGIDSVPESFTVGTLGKFSWDSAWWVFNFAANFANLKYSYMLPEILALQRDIEGKLLEVQPAIEKTALELAKSNPEMLRRYLTDYSVTQGEMVVARWRQLGEHLITKYNDGYVKDEAGEPQEMGYPESWLREVVGARPDQFLLETKKADVPESELVD